MGTRLIRRSWAVGGTPTDVTSALMSDAGGAYGIKRTIGGAVEVADGTAMTKVGTGVYEYEFVEPVENIAYTAWVEFVYGGNTYRFEHELGAMGSTPDALTLEYSVLRRLVGRKLGLDRDPDLWEPTDTTDVDDVIRAGLRQFYWPPLLEGQERRHTWRFLVAPTTLGVTSGDYDINLPADYAGLIGAFSFAQDGKKRNLQRVDSDDLLAHLAMGNVSGAPRLFALRAKAHTPTTGLRYEVLFYPVPDASYTLNYTYVAEPDMIDATNKYPPGGAAHSETIVESCLAVAESHLDDEEGVHHGRFMRALTASIQAELEQLEQ